MSWSGIAMPVKRSRTDAVRGIGLNKLLTLVIGGLIVALGFWAAAWKLYSFSISIATPDLPEVLVDAGPLMPRPDLTGAAALPATADLDAAEAEARSLLASGSRLPGWIDSCEPLALAWARIAPFASPVSVGAWELGHGRLDLGTAVRVHGQVAGQDAAEGSSWRRAVLEVERGRFVQVLLPGNASTENRIVVEGFFLGAEHLPAMPAGTAIPVIIARSVSARLPVPALDEVRAPQQWPAIAADQRWSEIDDHALVDDPTPIRSMLSIVGRDPEEGNAVLLNQIAGSVYADPGQSRGRPVRVTGTVLRAWEDQRIEISPASDHQRVVRVLMHHRDVGPITEKGPDGKTRLARTSVLRLYELAYLSDEPLPTPGQELLAQGRFLRLVARPIQPRPDRVESGDRAYSLLVVAHGLHVLSNPGLGQLPRWRIGVMIVSGILGFILLRHGWMQRREYLALAASLAESRRRRAEAKHRTANPGPHGQQGDQL